MNNSPATEALPPSLRLLKWLVIILTATMIVGVITVVGLLVTRMPNGTAPVAMPDSLALPEGTQPAALTMGRDFIAVVTEDDRIMIFGRDGLFRQEIQVVPAPAPEPLR